MPRGAYTASPAWTDARVETLRRLWKEGVSAAGIADVLGGVTRCAVIGKARRLGLSERPPRAARLGSAAARWSPKPGVRVPAIPRRGKFDPNPGAGLAFRRARTKSSVKPHMEQPPGPAALSRAVAWAERGAGQCAWILGEPDGAASRCCGQPVDPAAARRPARARYCAAHGAAAIAAVQPKPVRAPAEDRPRPRAGRFLDAGWMS